MCSEFLYFIKAAPCGGRSAAVWPTHGGAAPAVSPQRLSGLPAAGAAGRYRGPLRRGTEGRAAPAEHRGMCGEPEGSGSWWSPTERGVVTVTRLVGALRLPPCGQRDSLRESS